MNTDELLADLDRLEKLTSKSNRVASALATVSLLLWVWVRAPGLGVSVAVSGVQIVNINVGYAIIFGPIILFFMITWGFLASKRAYLLKDAIEKQIDRDSYQTSTATSVLLKGFHIYSPIHWKDLYWFGNKVLKGFWYFILPGIVSLILVAQIADLVPIKLNGKDVVSWHKEKQRYACIDKNGTVNDQIEPCNWSKWKKATYWLLKTDWTKGSQPILMNRQVERNKDIGGSFPYLYIYVVWLLIILCLMNIVILKLTYRLH